MFGMALVPPTDRVRSTPAPAKCLIALTSSLDIYHHSCVQETYCLTASGGLLIDLQLVPSTSDLRSVDG